MVIPVAALVVLFLQADTSRIYACSCVPSPPPLEALAKADAVFSGEVVSISEPGGLFGSWLVSSTGPVTVEFRVSAVWKGDSHETMSIKTAWSSASCGFEFALDEQYIVYAREGWASLCSRTKSIHTAREDLAALGEGVATVPGPRSDTSGIGGLPFFKIAVLAIAAALIVWLVLRARSRRLPPFRR